MACGIYAIDQLTTAKEMQEREDRRAAQTYTFRNRSMLTLPDRITNEADNVVVLDLTGNMFSTIPTAIMSLPNLERLTLPNNLITNITPEIMALTNLTELNLSNNKITDLPIELFKLTKLKLGNLQVRQLSQDYA